MTQKIAIVLTGGGARGAYQAGVLKGIADVLGPKAQERFPFSIISGVSAGAINAAFLGGHAGNYATAATELCQLWGELKTKAVIKTDFLSLSSLAGRWLKDLSTGGVLGRGKATHLLDSTPLRDLISKRVDFSQMKENVRSGLLEGISFTATNYLSGTAVTFYDGSEKIQPWMRSSRMGKREELTLDHVLASASIPVFFKPVQIGKSFWGDGGIRQSTPLSPAIHLGADKIIAIGIRYARSEAQTVELNQQAPPSDITLALIGGVLLNALFLDALDADVERLERINQTVELLSQELAAKHPAKLRKIPLLAIKPSQDLGSLAANEIEKFPWILKHMLRGTGAGNNHGWDMVSYLAFEESYTSKLIEVGFEDAVRARDEIHKIFD